MKREYFLTACCVAIATVVSGAARAQSSDKGIDPPQRPIVPPAAAGTPLAYQFYGVLDEGYTWTNNRVGGPVRYFRQGSLVASKIGFRGTYDLGDGIDALFDLQEGYDPNNGTESTAGQIFNRAAWAGLYSAKYGMLTAGRQYTPYFQYVGTLTGTPSYMTGGTVGAHPGDYDGLDTSIHVNNSIYYQTPNVDGITGALEYGDGQTNGTSASAGSTYSGGVKYVQGPLTAAVGYLKVHNTGLVSGVFDPNASGSFTTSVVNQGYVSAASIQYVAGAFNYALGSWILGLNVSGVTYTPGAESLFKQTARLHSVGGVAYYKITDKIDVGGDFSVTKAAAANGITDAAEYTAFGLRQTYHFNKYVSLYAIEGSVHADGMTLGKKGAGNIIVAAPVVGDGQTTTPSSTSSQQMYVVGAVFVF